MGFAEMLTIFFIILKLAGGIDWNWFLVLLPEIIFSIFVYIPLFYVFGITIIKSNKELKETRKELNKERNRYR